MGLETIVIVGIVIIGVAIMFGLGRARRKATRTHSGNPPAGAGGPRH